MEDAQNCPQPNARAARRLCFRPFGYFALWLSVFAPACAANSAPVFGSRPNSELVGAAGSGGAPATVSTAGMSFGGPSTGIAGSDTGPANTAGTFAADGGTGSEQLPAGTCSATSASAPPAKNPAVDIVWVVDASGSMLDEQIKIGKNLTDFAQRITQANIDVQIVMLTTQASIPVICPDEPSDPLAGTPLASDPRYHFIDSDVGSHNALDVLTQNYAMYSSFLRPGAATHLVVVSDDESSYGGLATPDERAARFGGDMKALLGHDFTLHTISSEGPTACSDPNCAPDLNSGLCAFAMLGCGASAPGTTYYTLAATTHGLSASICQSDWNAIFEPLSATVIASAPLPCDYAIPAPPSGEILDPTKVNVNWRATGSATDTVFGKAADAAACADLQGWHYDDASHPTTIALCPVACSTVAAGGTISIGFGCATIELQ